MKDCPDCEWKIVFGDGKECEDHMNNAQSEIQRYCFACDDTGLCTIPIAQGDYVLHSDHLAAITKLTESNLYLRTETVKDHVKMMNDAKVIEELKKALGGIKRLTCEFIEIQLETDGAAAIELVEMQVIAENALSNKLAEVGE